jgi:hypothetical protein
MSWGWIQYMKTLQSVGVAVKKANKTFSWKQKIGLNDVNFAKKNDF